ncbi:hypothetical protein QWY79_03670 [Halomonas sabkhae]|uniref:hypothetical protein n=1 Tax=Halomonas sabkhae TaxID=626223 RepID=UPI0025B2DDE1|nr:hypothetical protein [Halomonas sabkhae]MDN3524361.1 hypothetical protein [Halomonas sabkhae]
MVSSVTFPSEFGGDGQTYTDDADPDTGLDGLGYLTRFVPCLSGAVEMAAYAKDRAAAVEAYVSECQQLRDQASQSATAAASSASAASDSETNAGQSATAAASSASAASDSETNAGQSATAAASSASAASDSETNAGQSATAAASSASAASGSETNAGQSASAAASSASAASDSETNAEQSATAADSSASAASGSADSALAARNSAEDLYGDLQAVRDARDDAATSAQSASDSAQSAVDTAENLEANFDILVRDVERANFEAATGGACTLERTPNGQACHMFVIPRLRWEELVPSGELSNGTHEGFVKDSVGKPELLVGMYMAAEVNGELVSQPRRNGCRSVDWDQANNMAQASGFDLMSNWQWSAVAFWCMANGFQPRGNTDYGRSHSHLHERGQPDNDPYDDEYTLLGTGPNSWRHNNAANGIADLVGNRWEWVWGVKMVDGRIFMAPDSGRGASESEWEDTGFDMPNTGASNWSGLSTQAPQNIRRALLMPNGVADPDGSIWTNLDGERFPRRGGARGAAGDAGLSALALSSQRSHSRTIIGLRLSRLV